MVLEATVICLDNSDWMRNGDYTPTRLEAQQDAINLICGAKTQQNPESTVAVLAGAGKSAEVLVTLTSDLGKVLSSLAETKIGGTFDFLGAMQVAQLVLKHRQNKNQHQRVIVFVGSPIAADAEALLRLSKRLKKNNIAVDIVNFGEEAYNTEKLEGFIGGVNSNDNSHLVTVPPGPHILSDILVTSPIITGEDGPSPGAPGAGAEFGAYGAIDDPELALALKMSMEEERARQEEAKKKQQSEGPASPAPLPATPLPSITTSPEVEMGETGRDMDDDAMLQEALALSMHQEKAAVSSQQGQPAHLPAPDVQMDDDDEEMRLALQMSLGPTPEKAATQQEQSSGAADISKVMGDANFLNSILATLPGVDPDDERIKNALKQLEKKDDKK